MAKINLPSGFLETATAKRYDEKPKSALFHSVKGAWVLASLDANGELVTSNTITNASAVAWLIANGVEIPADLADPSGVEV